MYGIGREVYDACGSGMQSIKLSAASFLWKKYNGLFSRSKWMRREPSKDTGLLLLLHLYIFKKKLLWHSVPWVWDGSSCPRGITSLDGSRHTSHAQHLYTYIIYYVKTVMNEYSVYTPPPFRILLQMNNQMKYYTTESRPFNFWHGPLIFLCFFGY